MQRIKVFKDRNNKVIHCGDIIKVIDKNLYGKPSISKGKVYFDKDLRKFCVRFFPKGDYSGFDDLLEDYANICEVIESKRDK